MLDKLGDKSYIMVEQALNQYIMPRTTEQNEAIRQATQAAIVNSAMKLFAQHGYAHTTTRMITRQAGISTGLMYHYFDSKDSLLKAVFDNYMAIISEAFDEAYHQSQPQERIAGILRAILAMLREDTEFWDLFYALRNQPAFMDILGDSIRAWMARLRNLFIAEFKSIGRAEPELEALILYSLIEGTIQQYLLDPANYPLDIVGDRIIDQFGTP